MEGKVNVCYCYEFVKLTRAYLFIVTHLVQSVYLLYLKATQLNSTVCLGTAFWRLGIMSVRATEGDLGGV
jgi:hypothetical protein